MNSRESLIEKAIEVLEVPKIWCCFTESDSLKENKVKTDPLKEKVVELLKDLKKEYINFSPKLQICSLSNVSSAMHNYNFFKVDIPVTLKSAVDWAFTSLVCSVSFCPDEEDNTQVDLLPTIHDIFPSDVWQDILCIEDSISLLLDENLEFQAEVDELEGKWRQLGGKVKTKLNIKGSGDMRVVLGPFSYRVRKANIKSRGRGNTKAIWELNGTKYVDEQDICLGIILRVPKIRTQSISVIGAVEAQHDFQIWSADILKYKRFFSGAIQQFFEEGASIKETKIWKDVALIE